MRSLVRIQYRPLRIRTIHNNALFPGIDQKVELDMKIGKRIMDLTDEMYSSPGGLFLSDELNLGITYRLFQKNHVELQTLLLQYRDLEFAEKLLRGSVDVHATGEEALRLLHNFLAVATTLVDHTRIFARTHRGSDEEVETYEAIVKRTFVQPLPRFFKGLRNYVLHKGLFFLPFQVLGVAPKEESMLILRVKEMRSWDGWSSEARAYLEEAPDDLPLDEVVDAYVSLVADFYRWFGQWNREVHRPQIEDFNNRWDEIEKLKALEKSGVTHVTENDNS